MPRWVNSQWVSNKRGEKWYWEVYQECSKPGFLPPNADVLHTIIPCPITSVDNLAGYSTDSISAFYSQFLPYRSGTCAICGDNAKISPRGRVSQVFCEVYKVRESGITPTIAK